MGDATPAACWKVRATAISSTTFARVQPQGVLVAYGKDADRRPLSLDLGKSLTTGRKARELREHLEHGRLMPLAAWLTAILQ